MDDHNSNRNDGYRSNRDGYRSSGDYNGSRQAEQFDDRDSSMQQGEWSDDTRNRQGGGDRRPAAMYYEEYIVRAPLRGRMNSGNDGDGRQSYRSRDRDYGPSRYDNGLDYYTSESQGGRDFSRDRGRYGGMSDYGTGSGSSRADRYRSGYDRDERGGDNDRGFLEKAGDEVASWFGDEDAARRRKMDHRGKGPANYTRSDERIHEDACDCLSEDWNLDASNITVSVSGGEVTLDGTVEDRWAKRRAEDLVDEVSGVGHVQNNLRVSDGSTRTSDVSDS